MRFALLFIIILVESLINNSILEFRLHKKYIQKKSSNDDCLSKLDPLKVCFNARIQFARKILQEAKIGQIEATKIRLQDSKNTFNACLDQVSRSLSLCCEKIGRCTNIEDYLATLLNPSYNNLYELEEEIASKMGPDFFDSKK